jgi:hypothetical protein
MKPFTDALDRLLRSAAQAPSRAAGELPLRTAAGALAGWRGGESEESGFASLPLFRRGLVLAGALAAVTVAASLWEMSRDKADVWSVSDTVLNVASIQ